MENPFTPVPEFEEVPEVEPVDDELVVVRELVVFPVLAVVRPELGEVVSEDPVPNDCALADAETRIVSVRTENALITKRIIEESSFPRSNFAYRRCEISDRQAISFIVQSVQADQSLTIESSGRI